METFEAAERASIGHPYPVYMTNLRAAGVRSYHVTVRTLQRCIFPSAHNHHLDIAGPTYRLHPADRFDLAELKAALLRTQSGETDYPTFMQEIAAAGVHYYVADVVNRRVKYFGKDPYPPYEESIP